MPVELQMNDDELPKKQPTVQTGWIDRRLHLMLFLSRIGEKPLCF